MLFEFSSYPRHTAPLLLVRDYEYYGIPTLIKNFFFRFSFCHASHLHPFPFSATTQIIDEEEGLHGGATPASWSFYFFFISIDSHWIIDHVMIFQSWPLPGKLTIVNYHGWSSLL